MKKTNKMKVNKKSNKSINLNINSLSKKQIITLMSVLFVGVFVLVLTTSYAMFVTTVRGKKYVINTGTLIVKFNEPNGNINLNNVYPKTITEALSDNSINYNFNIENTGTLTAKYQLRLEIDDSIKNLVPLEYIRISYKKNNEEYSEPILLSELNSNLVITQNQILNTTATDNYILKLWLDYNAPIEEAGKQFKARVVVDVIQNIETGYGVDTKPIIILSKDANGNIDQNLKVGAQYQELDVDRVTDDIDTLTVGNVTRSYEYYNPTTEQITTVNGVDTNSAGVYYVTYSVTDTSGNIGKAVRIITVNNTDVLPTITLNGASSVTYKQGEGYNELGATVTSGNQLVILGEAKTTVVGTHIIKYVVIDSNGNVNSVTRSVVVTEQYFEPLLNGSVPILTNNLVPVKISDTGVVTKADTQTRWYSYEDKEWANAIVLKDNTVNYEVDEEIPESNIESYFVWIPKYSYKIFDMGNYTTSPQTENIPNNYVNKAENTPIDIRFGTTNTVDSNTECVTPLEAGTSGTCSVGKYMTHPAFITMNSNGLWVGKFETGYEGAAPGNIYDTSRIVVKPNVYSWRNISVGNIFKNSYNYLRNEDSHMMKNIEWGAMAYLTNSIYGTCTGNTCSEVRINNNSNYITGFSGVEEPTVTYNRGISIDGNRVEGVNPGVDGTYTINYLNTDSVLSSTTQNYTGIYDTSGGAYEYVAGYTMIEGAADLSGITTLYNNFYNDTDYSKYWDKYSSNSWLGYNKRILGDATGELGSFIHTKDLDDNYRTKSSWNKDIAFFATTSAPWFTRGYAWFYGVEAGIFAFLNNSGNIDTSISSRIVLAPRNN